MLVALNKIKTILDTIPDEVLPLTFKYLDSMPASFPAGCVLSAGFNEEMIDSGSNQITESFVIRLIYPQAESVTGYEKWLTLADLVSAEFRKKENQTLGGDAISMMVKQGLAPEFSDQYVQPVVMFDILIEAKIIKSI